MTDILVLSLGTTPQPIEQCISRLRPRRTVFVCSQDTRELVDQILRSVRVPGFDAARDVMVLSQSTMGSDASEGEIDQLHAVYERCRALFFRLRQEEPGSRISVDYTGGTKTMATGLGLAAIDDGGVDLLLMTGDRRKPSEGVISGNSRPVPVNAGAIHFRRLLSDGLEPLLRRFDYAAAQASVSSVLRKQQHSASRAVLHRLEDQLLALDAWDRWDLVRAQSLFKDHAREDRIRSQFLFPLQRVMQSCELLNPPQQSETNLKASKALKDGKLHGFEAVEDLLLNAARRASQERYDDAVGRLYRSMELTAQLLLQIDHDGIRSGDVDLERLPEFLRSQYEEKRRQDDGKIKLGLADSFDLLADLENPVGSLWRQRRKVFLDKLKVRNHSLLAHGFQPVIYQDWLSLEAELAGFLHSILDARRGTHAPLGQLPSTLTGLGIDDGT